MSSTTSPTSGFLNIEELRVLHNQQELFTSPDNDVDDQLNDQIQHNPGVGFDIRLGEEFYLSGESYTCSSRVEQGIHIQPGQFALLTTFEQFHMPNNLVAFISMRFGVKAEGLINVSGFQVDPGFNGVFTFSVYNAGPNEIHLNYKSRVFTVIFAKTAAPAQPINRPTATGIDFKYWTRLRTPKKLSLIGLDERLSKLEYRIGLAKYLVPVFGVAVTVIIGILTLGRGGVPPG